MYRFREMVELDGGGASEKQPQQISDMFQKFALAFKAKTYELFAEESVAVDSDGDVDVALLLDSAEELIPDQKVVVVKPESTDNSGEESLIRALIPSLFATISSFEAAYLQFQAAHVPEIDRSALQVADELIVSILQKLSEIKKLYHSRKGNLWLSCGYAFPAGSIWEFQVQENQSKLRVLETVVNTLQSQIDVKDDEVRDLRKKLDQIRVSIPKLDTTIGSQTKLSLTIHVFEGILRDSVKSIHHFTKFLIDMMKKAGWNLEEAAASVYPGINYAKKGHFRYAFMSYICLRMCQNFNENDYGLSATDGSKLNEENNSCLKRLVEHVESDHMEILGKNPECEFSRFCEHKYEQLIHPTMESSIFSRNEKVLDSWKSMNGFYESFVSMGSSMWLLHGVANLFNPVVEIFQVERGVEFSMVYMEDITMKFSSTGKTKPIVGFTVVPGFKFGRTVIQSQVYLTNSTSTDD